MEDKWNSIEKRLKDWMKRNKPFMTVSLLGGFLLTPFLWPFFLAIIYTSLSLAVPIFLILLGIKMPWRRKREEEAEQESKQEEKQEERPNTDRKEKENKNEQRKDTFSKRENSQNGKIPEQESEEKSAAGRKDESKKEEQRDAALSWYVQEGKERILRLMKKAESEGAFGISIRKDGICSAKKAGDFYRIGALRGFPGNDMNLIADMLNQDVKVPFIKVKGKYLCIFWKRDRQEGRI